MPEEPRRDDDLELMPHEWRSERPKPKEPFFGPGLLWFFGFCVMILIVATIKHYIINPMLLR